MRQKLKVVTQNPSSSFDQLLNKITFGYENFEKIKINQSPKLFQVFGDSEMLSSILDQATPRNELNCVTSTCNRLNKYRCCRGHLWDAIDGTPACSKCPICKFDVNMANLLGYDRKLMKSIVLMRQLKQHASKYGGDVSTEWTPSKTISTSSSINFICKKGHEWHALVQNIISKNQWCPECHIEKRALELEANLHTTAAAHNGIFLGFILDSKILNMNNNTSSNSSMTDEYILYSCRCSFEKSVKLNISTFGLSNFKVINLRIVPMETLRFHQKTIDDTNTRRLMKRKGLWQCQYGHTFIQYSDNIRCRNGLRRHPTWCPQCSREHRIYKVPDSNSIHE